LKAKFDQTYLEKDFNQEKIAEIDAFMRELEKYIRDAEKELEKGKGIIEKAYDLMG
jgi:hypothetical protein